MQFTRIRLYKSICIDICTCLKTYEVLEYDEYKLDKMFVKMTHNMLNIYIGM